MTRRLSRRVLLIDNDRLFLETRKEALEEAGYEVLTATTLEEARAILRRQHIHLAAIDVRMVDDESDHDMSGLKLAREPEFAEIVKLMMTSYDRDPDVVNDTVATSEPGTPATALRFLSKAEGLAGMLKWFDWAIGGFCGINWNLDIDPPYALMADLAARLGGAPRDEWNDRGDELTDLLAMAFFPYERARIDRLLWHYDQRLALAVTAARGDHSDQRIAVIANRAGPPPTADRIIPERAPEGFAQYVKPARPLHTLHYAAELYELPEARLDETTTLREFFQTTRPAALADLVHRLVPVSLRPLSQTELPRGDEGNDALLRARAGLPPAAANALRRRLEEVGAMAARSGVATVRLGDGQLSIRLDESPHLYLPDPADWLARPGPADFARPLRLGETAGVPPAETILVNPSGRFWLTDFSQQQRGPLLSNLADLEAQVILDLYPAPNLTQFAEAQRRLVRPRDLSARVEGTTPEMKKAFTAIREIRDEAARLGADPEAYFRALFYQTAQRLLAMPLDVIGRDKAQAPLYAALSLGLLAERLAASAQAAEAPPPSRPGLWIDEATARCWLDDTLLPALPPTPYRFLLYLWQHPRTKCPNAAIMAAVLATNSEDWDVNYPDVLAAKVRQALGPQPNRYLVSFRGGYILYPDGRPDRPL